MQPLSAPISDLLFLHFLFYLARNHHSERLSGNVILRREPKNLQILRRPTTVGLLRMTHSVGCRTSSLVCFREKEMQSERHEVCLKYRGLD